MEGKGLLKCYWVLRRSEKNFQDLYLKHTLDVLSNKSIIEIFEFLSIVPHLPAMFACETVNLRCLHVLNTKEGWYLRKNRRNGPCL